MKLSLTLTYDGTHGDTFCYKISINGRGFEDSEFLKSGKYSREDLFHMYEKYHDKFFGGSFYIIDRVDEMSGRIWIDDTKRRSTIGTRLLVPKDMGLISIPFKMLSFNDILIVEPNNADFMIQLSEHDKDSLLKLHKFEAFTDLLYNGHKIDIRKSYNDKSALDEWKKKGIQFKHFPLFNEPIKVDLNDEESMIKAAKMYNSKDVSCDKCEHECPCDCPEDDDMNDIIKSLTIKDVVFSGYTTIVFWEDGSKTVVTMQSDEHQYDIEKAIAFAFMKNILSMLDTAKERSVNNILDKWEKRLNIKGNKERFYIEKGIALGFMESIYFSTGRDLPEDYFDKWIKKYKAEKDDIEEQQKKIKERRERAYKEF